MKNNDDKLITTVTLNPAIDNAYIIDELSLGKICRLKNEKDVITSPGGKGVNVSIFLRKLGIETIAMGIIGGHTGKMLEGLIHDENVTTNFVHINGETRCNITIIDSQQNHITTISQSGPKISHEELEIFIDRYKKMVRISKVIILSGSIPPGVPNNIYATLIDIANKENKPCILNCPGKPFEIGVEAGPLVAYPDVRGVPEFFSEKINSLNGLFSAGEKILNMNSKIELVILSKPSIQELVIITKTSHYDIEIEDIKMTNLYGFSDSITGGIAYGLVHAHNLLESLKIGIAAGIVKLESINKYNADLQEIVNHVKRVKMHSILTKNKEWYIHENKGNNV